MYGAVREEVSESWLHTYDLSSTMIPNVSSPVNDEEHVCKMILYKEIKDSRVRIWDIVILIPNLLFLLFIAVRFNRARLKLRATSSPIFLAFYGLVICNVVISVIRCIVSMSVNAAATVGGKADKILWVTVRFFLLSTEMSVVIFGLAFGHLDSRSSIRRVLLATSLIALAFTITQGTLELVLPDDTFHIPSRDFYVFGHGGMMFWFCSSLVFTMIYLFILILPWTRLRDRLTLPTRKSFYIYAGTLAMLDLVQSIGAGFLNYTQNMVGLCVVDFTAAVYLTLFTPLVYHTFLSEFFGVSQPSIMFSYKAQVDDAMDEDTVSLPHQQSFSSLKTDSDYIYQVHTPSIHMPLYGSQAFKPPSKHKSSSHSLASTKDSKTGSGHIYDSPVALYRSTSGIKSFSRRLSAEKSPSSLKKYPLTKSDNFIDSKNSSLDLKLTHHTWKSKSASQFKYGGPSSVSNLLFSPNTASSFLYKSGANDSNTNLFSLARKGSLMHERKRSEGNVSSQFFEIPPLENTLQSILDSSTNDGSEVKRSTSSRESSRKDNTAARDSQNIEKKESSRLMQQTDAAVSEIDVGDTSDSIDASTVRQQLLSKPASSTSEEAYEKRKKKDTKKKESGGLSDYLLSLAVSIDEKEEKDTEVDPSPFPSRHVKSYTQTESL
ncbi:transmembrane protein adipocyte-associated 1 homolog isoform X1 [Frieseomelitta varia]|uniref:transmembrane protein adipocyte-associated 1 homolog isoform X1 n=1 Tax=Frieseomelitta varia TaxID=561572 RepID=UPI001CB68579|nr:transmembrane protein adipocyte-associated 1 homolog isoform X1 [Frieseomelitta varia]XP_043515598.1 transmembrane protein adipocyte-associated 1 homolog isoform X1 [Frieseomelitta varia]